MHLNSDTPSSHTPKAKTMRGWRLPPFTCLSHPPPPPTPHPMPMYCTQMNVLIWANLGVFKKAARNSLGKLFGSTAALWETYTRLTGELILQSWSCVFLLLHNVETYRSRYYNGFEWIGQKVRLVYASCRLLLQQLYRCKLLSVLKQRCIPTSGFEIKIY